MTSQKAYPSHAPFVADPFCALALDWAAHDEIEIFFLDHTTGNLNH